MEKAKTVLEIYCAEERAVVGTISLAPGQKFRFSTTEVTARFVPASPDFELSKTRAPLRDGEVWRCPRCVHALSVRGKLGKDSVDAAIILGALSAKG